VLAQAAQELPAVDAGQHHVQENDPRLPRRDRVQCFLRIANAGGPVARAGQMSLEQLE